MRLVIDRSRWLTGDVDDSWLFRRRDGKMCCLGFCALALGYDVADIAGAAIPSDVNRQDLRVWPRWMLETDRSQLNSDVFRLMQANDSSILTDEDRERRVAEIFAKHGIEVEFIDGEQS